MIGSYVIGPFTLASELIGAENAALMTITEPETVKAALDPSVDVICMYARSIEVAGADVIVILEPDAMYLSAEKFNEFSALYVNTDSPEIAAAARRYDVACPVLRPAHLASDDTPTEPANRFLLEFLAARGERFDVVVILQPTSPLRTADDIRAAFELHQANAPCTVVSASPVAPADWLGHIGKDGRFEPLPGRDVVYRLNGAVYIHRCEDYMQNRRPARTMVYPMPAARGVDIDTQDDFEYAAILLQQHSARTASRA